MSTYVYGVWQGGMEALDLEELSVLAIGTHVGNYPHIILGSYEEGDYIFVDITNNATYCDDAVTYVETYGATYAAVFYRSTLCNVRSLEWI